jgi:hypothetical protein
VMIAVERDKDGIRMAALELLEEGLHAEDRARVERIAEQSADPHDVLAAAAPKRQFAAGYYLWVSYLLDLEMEMQFGVSIAATLAGADVLGLFAVREARREFEREHPQCRCGRRKKRAWDQTCGQCEATQ